MSNFLQRLPVAWQTLRGSVDATRAKQLVGLFDPSAANVAHGILSGVITTSEAPPRGTVDLLRAYTTQPWIRTVADRVADANAAVQWKLYARRSRGAKQYTRDLAWQSASGPDRAATTKELAKTGELREIDSHPMLDLLYRGNSMLTGRVIRKLTSLYVDLVGENIWFKERGAYGVPIAVWPIPPHWVRALPTPARPYYDCGYRSWTTTMPDTDILYWTTPNLENPYGRGAGLANVLSDEIDTDKYAAAYLKNLFYNRGAPTVIVHGEGLNEGMGREMERTWRQKFAGATAQVAPFFTNLGVKVTEVGQNNRDLRVSELRTQQRDTILQTWGMPPEVFGIVENSNRATITAADYLMGKYVQVPRLEYLREILQERLVPEYDDRIVIDYVSPVGNDADAEAKHLQALPEIAQIDEHRARAGLPPLEDGTGAGFLRRNGTQYVPDIDAEPSLPATAFPPG